MTDKPTDDEIPKAQSQSIAGSVDPDEPPAEPIEGSIPRRAQSMNDGLYQEVAQLLIDYHETVAAEYVSTGEPEAVWGAKRLYERHGPFELEFSTWRWDKPPDWYRGADDD